MAIPSSPGYVGMYQWLGVAALGLFDVPVEEALAFPILLQASWFIPTAIAGERSWASARFDAVRG